jgi:hypothetical protein
MTWFDVLKTSQYIRGKRYADSPSIDDWQETARNVADKLEQALNEDGLDPEGEWIEELGGYRDSTDSTYLSGIIEMEPTFTWDEVNDSEDYQGDENTENITVEFDLNYDSLFGGLRVGSYTGNEGLYVAYEDWTKHDWVELVQLERDLDEYMER